MPFTETIWSTESSLMKSRQTVWRRIHLAAQILAFSQARGAGWLYVTDLGGDNPYAGPPTYWNAEAAMVANQGIQDLYATARPAGGAVVAPKERIEVGADGRVRVFTHERDGNDKDWDEVNAHAVAFSLEEHVHLVESDSRGLGEPVTYQIRSFDGENRVLSVSEPVSLSVANTQYIFDVTDH
jgi:hypothetical protein